MIKLLHPEIIPYIIPLIIALILAYLYVYMKRRRILRITMNKDHILWHVIQLLKITSIILLLIAAAMPVHIGKVEQVVPGNPEKTEIRNIIYNITALHVLLIDESKSMMYKDNTNTSRYILALNFTYEYLKHLSPKDKLLIIGFAEYPEKICLGNITYCKIRLSQLRFDKRFTDISDALAYAYSYVTAAQYPAIIVIISDGAYNEGGDPLNDIVSINKSGYPVLFVRVGLDPRADKLVNELINSKIYVINANEYTEKLIHDLARDAAQKLRLEAFIAKKLLEVKITREVIDPYPTIILLILGLATYVSSRIEGY